MWHSLTPKMIHVNQRWMVITDDKKVATKLYALQIPFIQTTLHPNPFSSVLKMVAKNLAMSFVASLHLILIPTLPSSHPPQVMYAEFLVAAVGSLAYAEDDSRHILGIKVARSPASLRGGVGEGEGIECHVLECESEVSSNGKVPLVKKCNTNSRNLDFHNNSSQLY